MSEQKRRLLEDGVFEQDEDDEGIFSSLPTKIVCECYPANENTDSSDTDYEEDED